MSELNKLGTVKNLRDFLSMLPDDMKILILHFNSKGYQPLKNAVIAPDIRDKDKKVLYFDNESNEDHIINLVNIVDKIKKFIDTEFKKNISKFLKSLPLESRNERNERGSKSSS